MFFSFFGQCPPSLMYSRGTCSLCFIAASPPEPLPWFHGHRDLQMSVGSSGHATRQSSRGLSQVLRLVAVSVGYSTRQRVGGTCRILHEIAQATQVVVEHLLSHHEIFCCASTALPLGSGPLLSVVCLSLQFSGPQARIFQVDTRCIVKSSVIVDLPEGDVEAFARALHFIQKASLVLLGRHKLVHCSVRFSK